MLFEPNNNPIHKIIKYTLKQNKNLMECGIHIKCFGDLNVENSTEKLGYFVRYSCFDKEKTMKLLKEELDNSIFKGILDIFNFSNENYSFIVAISNANIEAATALYLML